jgi:two-component system nitrogen regulation sensor histidine kinase GlnL
MVGPNDIPTKSNINVHKILQHVRQLILAENDHISISVDYDPSIPEIHVDESMLIQVILNITRNAVHAIAASEELEGKIVFKTRTQRNCKIGAKTYHLAAKIDIEDNGCGVSENLKETIFMPMITGHAEGTGLGLSIAQSLVQQHNGLLEFTSEPGKTIFTLLLPITSLDKVTNGAGQ